MPNRNLLLIIVLGIPALMFLVPAVLGELEFALFFGGIGLATALLIAGFTVVTLRWLLGDQLKALRPLVAELGGELRVGLSMDIALYVPFPGGQLQLEYVNMPFQGSKPRPFTRLRVPMGAGTVPTRALEVDAQGEQRIVDYAGRFALGEPVAGAMADPAALAELRAHAPEGPLVVGWRLHRDAPVAELFYAGWVSDAAELRWMLTRAVSPVLTLSKGIVD